MRVSLISTLPFRLEERKPGLIPEYYEILPAPKDGISVTGISDGHHNMLVPLSDDKTPPIRIIDLGEKIAEAIIQDYTLASLGIDYTPHEETGAIAVPGFFWVEGNIVPSIAMKVHESKIKSAINNTKRWFERLVKIADDDWQRYHQFKMITDLQRSACKYLSLEREWNFDVFKNQMSLCWSCKSSVHPEAITCSSCRAILNMEEYKKRKDSYATQ
jgi:hypothetical protein